MNIEVAIEFEACFIIAFIPAAIALAQREVPVVVVQPRLPTLTYTVTAVDEGRSFTWEAGSAVSRGVGEHVVSPRMAGGCTATLRLTQRGPAARLVGALLDRITRRYVRMEAEGLKARCEAS